MERFKLGDAFSTIQRKYNPPICFAVVGDEPIIDPERFGETVAVNRGVLGKVFTDIDEAVAWVEERVEKKQEC